MNINRIYCPCSSKDAILETVFPRKGEITYLDKRVRRHDVGDFGFVGDYTNPPKEIKDGHFDAVFIKDLHLHEQGPNGTLPDKKLKALLETLREGGIVIYGIRRQCDKWGDELKFLQSRPQLSNVELPYSSPNFHIFRISKTRP